MLLEVSAITRAGLQPVSFRLAAGECLAICAPSGAGKSLLLRAIADLDPNEGEVWLNGVARASMDAPAWRRQIGYLPAEPGWWAETVGEHFSDWAAIEPLVIRLGLPATSRDWPMSRPSSGERLRLALVRALSLQPSVLLLDEPTSALDPQAVMLVEALMLEQRQQGMGLIWVSHDPAQLCRVAQHRLVWQNGCFSDEGQG